MKVLKQRFSELGINLDDEAARVLTSSAQAVRAILDRRVKLDQAGRYDVPLIVLGGEIHKSPADIIHHMAILNGLNAHENTVLCTEIPHSFAKNMFQYLRHNNPSKKTRAALTELDRAGVLSLEACLGFIHMCDSSYANKVLQKFVLDEGIPTRFADAAREECILDSQDASTRASIRSCFNALSDVDNISVIDRMGMKIRNHHMVGQTMEHIQNHSARIAFLKCGTDHVAGEVVGGYPAQESLSAMLKEKGLPVFAMPVIRENAQLPSAHGLTSEELFPVEELSEVVTDYNPVNDMPLGQHWGSSLLQSTVQEAAYVNGVLERIGLQDRVLGVAQHVELMGLKKYKTLQAFEACDRVPSLAR